VREQKVKQILAEHLKMEGFMNLKVRYGHERGIDIEAQFPESGRWLYIEVKGTRTGAQAANIRQVFGEALLQIFSIYDGSSVCAIALPNTQEFRRLARQIFMPLSRLGVHALFVGKNGEIWHLGPKTPAGLPRRVSSLKEVL